VNVFETNNVNTTSITIILSFVPKPNLVLFYVLRIYTEIMPKYINDNMYLYECKNSIPNNGGHSRPLTARAKIQTQTIPYMTGGRKSGFGSGSAPQYFEFPLSVSFHQSNILIHSAITDAV